MTLSGDKSGFKSGFKAIKVGKGSNVLAMESSGEGSSSASSQDKGKARAAGSGQGGPLDKNSLPTLNTEVGKKGMFLDKITESPASYDSKYDGHFNPDKRTNTIDILEKWLADLQPKNGNPPREEVLKVCSGLLKLEGDHPNVIQDKMSKIVVDKTLIEGKIRECQEQLKDLRGISERDLSSRSNTEDR